MIPVARYYEGLTMSCIASKPYFVPLIVRIRVGKKTYAIKISHLNDKYIILKPSFVEL